MHTPRDYWREIKAIGVEEVLDKIPEEDMRSDELKKTMRVKRAELNHLKRKMDQDLYHIRSVYSSRLASNIKKSVLNEIFDEGSLTAEFEIGSREDLKKEKDFLIEVYKVPRGRIDELIERIDSSIFKKKSDDQYPGHSGNVRRVLR